MREGFFRKPFNHWKETIKYSKNEVLLFYLNGVQFFSMNGVPMPNCQYGLDYELWIGRTKLFLRAHGYDVCNSVLIGYNATKNQRL
jgi:hypothetical protein